MKIVVINGTGLKGVTYFMKNEFLGNFKNDAQITEFYPDKFPLFCLGCKNCFVKSEEKCPHYNKVNPIWSAMLDADLLVFAYPVYALRAPASIKSLLDHLCVHWLVHRPEKKFFEKTAVIITNSVGASNKDAQKDVKTSLSWMGVSKIYCCGAKMMGDIFIDKITDEHKKMIKNKVDRLYTKVKNQKSYTHKSLKFYLLFTMCKMLHKMVLNGEVTPSPDNQHYIDNGWIKQK